MNKKILAISLLLAVTASAMAQEHKSVQEINFTSTTPTPFIQISGYAEKKIIPDMIYIGIVIDENDTKGKVPVEQLERDMIKELVAAGIDVDKDLKTGDIQSNLRKYRTADSRARKSYELTLHGADKLMEVFDRLEKAGLSQVDVTKTSHSKLDEYKQQVKAECMVNARRDASVMIEALGQKLGKAIEVTAYGQAEVASEMPVLMMRSAKNMSVGVDYSAQPVVEFKEITVSAKATVKFEIM